MKEDTGSSRSSVGRAAIGVGRRKITEGVQEAEESRSRGGADERGGEDSLGSFFSLRLNLALSMNVIWGSVPLCFTGSYRLSGRKGSTK